jgi:CrcB protein
LAVSAAALVFVGGGAGAVARYALVRASEATLGTAFPYGVMVANIIGSFFMGVLVGWLMARGPGLGAFLDLDGHAAAKAALTTGLLGGFTTFSAFSLDAVRLWEAGNQGAALAYVGLSVIVSIAALVAGLTLARGVLA